MGRGSPGGANRDGSCLLVGRCRLFPAGLFRGLSCLIPVFPGLRDPLLLNCNEMSRYFRSEFYQAD